MATGTSLQELARAIKGRSGNNPVWVPRAPQLTLHQGTLINVDPYSGSVSFQFPDPNTPVLNNVGYVRPYTNSNQPADGHTAWGFQYGGMFVVLGQHVVQNNLVIP